MIINLVSKSGFPSYQTINPAECSFTAKAGSEVVFPVTIYFTGGVSITLTSDIELVALLASIQSLFDLIKQK